jgi:hypothetical protein
MEKDPLLEKLFESPERVAKLHIIITVAYIMFIVFAVIGLAAVIFKYLGYF